MIKHELRIKENARYMDDSYLIHESKEYLQYCLERIREKCAEYGIVINERKTQIVKLTKTFTFLKVRWTLTSTGKVIKRLNPDTITRERRKLKKFKEMLDKGLITMDDVVQQYESWKGDKGKPKKKKKKRTIRYSSYHTLQRMDQFYNELFKNYLTQGGTTNERQTQIFN